MVKTIFAVALCGAFATAFAAPVGGSSNEDNVLAGVSDAIPFGAGASGLSLDGSNSINLANGPIKYIREKYTVNNKVVPINGTIINGNVQVDTTADVNGLLNPKYLELKDINALAGIFYNPTLGQIWYEKRANDTDVYSIRQIDTPVVPIAPTFGGLVIGQVDNNAVYFGEWAPRAGSPSSSSDTNLNMASAERTVWYVGDNPTGNTTGLATANYNVLGINQHTPGQNDFYTGTLKADFSAGELSGSISRNTTDTISFANTAIDNTNGTFSRTDAVNGDVDGRFYGANAAAIAGIVDRAGVANDVAFGGKR